MVDQRREIDELTKKLDVLIRMFREMKAVDNFDSMPHVKPPHY